MHANPIDTSGSSDTDWREYVALKWGQSVCPHDFGKRLLRRRRRVSLPKVSAFRQRSVKGMGVSIFCRANKHLNDPGNGLLVQAIKKRKTRFMLLCSIQTMNFIFTCRQAQCTLRIWYDQLPRLKKKKKVGKIKTSASLCLHSRCGIHFQAKLMRVHKTYFAC